MSRLIPKLPEGDADQIALRCEELTRAAVSIRERHITEKGSCSLAVPTKCEDPVEWHHLLTDFIGHLEKSLKITGSLIPQDAPSEQSAASLKGKNLTEICLNLNGKKPVAPTAPKYTGLTAKVMEMKAAGQK
jgi:hypothetical protein